MKIERTEDAHGLGGRCLVGFPEADLKFVLFQGPRPEKPKSNGQNTINTTLSAPKTAFSALSRGQWYETTNSGSEPESVRCLGLLYM